MRSLISRMDADGATLCSNYFEQITSRKSDGLKEDNIFTICVICEICEICGSSIQVFGFSLTTFCQLA